MKIMVMCPKCGKSRTFNDGISQVRCKLTEGGCGAKININKKHKVIKWEAKKNEV